jgi:hypothetical protein
MTHSGSPGGDGRIVAGAHGSYQWLTSSFDHYMGTLVRLCPEVILVAVLGRYVY